MTSFSVISWVYTVRGIDDDTNVKMFLARFWRRWLWRWTFKEQPKYTLLIPDNITMNTTNKAA